MHAVYKALGLDLSESFDAYLQAQAEREKNHASKFEYSLGEYALTRETIENELKDFYDQYQWPRSSDAAG